METAENALATNDAPETPTESVEVAAERPRAPARSMPRWVIPGLAAQAGLLGLFAFTADRANDRLEQLASTVYATQQDVQGLEKRTAALATQTEELGGELNRLRQHIGSTTSEDVIFLKALILKPDIDAELARAIAKHVHHYCQFYARDADLVLAMIAIESNFDPRARSSAGAMGLMQVMPQWKKVLGIDGDLFDPEVSIRYGLQILGFYSEMYKDLEMALTAYNRGPGPVDMALMRGKDPKNGYAPRVLAAYERLKRLSVNSNNI